MQPSIEHCIHLSPHHPPPLHQPTLLFYHPLQSVPSIDIPLHTVMELVPKADGTMAETRFIVDVDKAMKGTAGLLHGAGEGLAGRQAIKAGRNAELREGDRVGRQAW